MCLDNTQNLELLLYCKELMCAWVTVNIHDFLCVVWANKFTSTILSSGMDAHSYLNSIHVRMFAEC